MQTDGLHHAKGCMPFSFCSVICGLCSLICSTTIKIPLVKAMIMVIRMSVVVMQA